MISALIISVACSWDNPGANPYRGSVSAAVHSYQDIPEDVRNRLQRRMEKRQYDEVADIRKDRIVGEHEYAELRDMHFGGNRLCRSVLREKWTDQSLERGLIYCEEGHCLIVPTVCNNVSRVTRLKTLTSSPSPSASATEPLQPVGVIIAYSGSTLSFSDKAEPGLPVVPSPYNLTPRGAATPLYGEPDASHPWIWPPLLPPHIIYVPAPPVPEPSTWMLLVLGLVAIATASRRNRRRLSTLSQKVTLGISKRT